MKILNQPSDVKSLCQSLRLQDKTIGLVPTMGNLHAGHLSLVEHIRPHVDEVIVTLFVNPAQFGANEDFDTYPRTILTDCEKLKGYQVDWVFTPTVKSVYPQGVEAHTKVYVPELSQILCGKTRPVFFQGVSSIVAKLFNLIRPHKAIFGEKDYQQLYIIKKMVVDLYFDVEILHGQTVREPDGLAMSSRNQYLSSEERKLAPLLYQTLTEIREQVLAGENQTEVLHQAHESLNQYGFETDYLALHNRDTFHTATDTCLPLVALGAAKLGQTRLIDNLIFDRTEP